VSFHAALILQIVNERSKKNAHSQLYDSLNYLAIA
jgi:hypothetical protein